MTRQGSPRPEDNGLFAVQLTAGEQAMFAKIAADEAAHNELAENLGKFKDHIVDKRNSFVGELCKKYNIQNPSKVTFDPRTGRFVSVFSEGLVATKIDTRPIAFKQSATRTILAGLRELLAIYKATHEHGPRS